MNRCFTRLLANNPHPDHTAPSFSTYVMEGLNLIVHEHIEAVWFEGWITCNFASLLTVFQSYQDNGRVALEGCIYSKESRLSLV